jgi:hypothetical protein
VKHLVWRQGFSFLVTRACIQRLTIVNVELPPFCGQKRGRVYQKGFTFVRQAYFLECDFRKELTDSPGAAPSSHHDSRVCNRFTNKAATLTLRRRGNGVARQRWLQTQGQELLLLTLMGKLCLRGGSCQHHNVGISFFR